MLRPFCRCSDGRGRSFKDGRERKGGGGGGHYIVRLVGTAEDPAYCHGMYKPMSISARNYAVGPVIIRPKQSEMQQ